jgi:hypothetical protein
MPIFEYTVKGLLEWAISSSLPVYAFASINGGKSGIFHMTRLLAKDVALTTPSNLWVSGESYAAGDIVQSSNGNFLCVYVNPSSTGSTVDPAFLLNETNPWMSSLELSDGYAWRLVGIISPGDSFFLSGAVPISKNMFDFSGALSGGGTYGSGAIIHVPIISNGVGYNTSMGAPTLSVTSGSGGIGFVGKLITSPSGLLYSNYEPKDPCDAGIPPVATSYTIIGIEVINPGIGYTPDTTTFAVTTPSGSPTAPVFGAPIIFNPDDAGNLSGVDVTLFSLVDRLDGDFGNLPNLIPNITIGFIVAPQRNDLGGGGELGSLFLKEKKIDATTKIVIDGISLTPSSLTFGDVITTTFDGVVRGATVVGYSPSPLGGNKYEVRVVVDDVGISDGGFFVGNSINTPVSATIIGVESSSYNPRSGNVLSLETHATIPTDMGLKITTTI